MICGYCGTELPATALFCGECGRSLAGSITRTAPLRAQPERESITFAASETDEIDGATVVSRGKAKAVPMPEPEPESEPEPEPEPVPEPEPEPEPVPEPEPEPDPWKPPAASAPVVVSNPTPTPASDPWSPPERLLRPPTIAALEDDVDETRIVATTATGQRYVLQFSTGESVTVFGTGLVGRNPVKEPAEYFDHMVTIVDPGKSVSKTHLEFGQIGTSFWVADRFSGNGTTIREPDTAARRCEPGKRYRIARGTRVTIGEQFFVVS